jgi:hypothetical protein
MNQGQPLHGGTQATTTVKMGSYPFMVLHMPIMPVEDMHMPVLMQGIILPSIMHIMFMLPVGEGDRDKNYVASVPSHWQRCNRTWHGAGSSTHLFIMLFMPFIMFMLPPIML